MSDGFRLALIGAGCGDDDSGSVFTQAPGDYLVETASVETEGEAIETRSR